MNTNREEKALFEFKHIMENLLQLLCKATEAQTGYLYWVNRKRQQFVLETSKTKYPNVMFKDRVAFDKYFLDDFKNIAGTNQLKVGRDIDRSLLQHYFDQAAINYLTIIPFQNNGETVALTVLETEDPIPLEELEPILSAYNNAHVNVLNTYLELTDLYEDEQKWADYDDSLKVFTINQGIVDIINKMIVEMQKLLPTGGIVVAVRGMNTWVTVLRSSLASKSPDMGLMVEEKSLAYEALQKGEPLFSIHFNQNPKRISSSELRTDGATYAIPMLIQSRRHAVVITYDKNPLIFKESVKHQLNNLARVAALSIKSEMNGLPPEMDLFTTEFGNFSEDLWRLNLEQQIHRPKSEKDHVWFGMIGIDNLTDLRSKYRLEDLKKLQRLMVKAINPSRLGYNGIIGYNSDYVFTYMISGTAEDDHRVWLDTNIDDLKNKLDLGDERRVEVRIKAGFIKLDDDKQDADQIVLDAKQALNMAISNRDTSFVNM